MPQIKVRGLEIEKVKGISKELVDCLEEIIECPRDYFTIECIPSIYIMDGKTVENFPLIEVAWFDRGQEIQDGAAEAITQIIQGIGYENVEIFFTVLEKNKYYENGKHF
ncbi:MAG: DUF1904 domain-containing protein [Bacillota bacterium]